MELEEWLELAVADAERRGLADLKPLLRTLGAATAALRAADWNEDASGEKPDAGTAVSLPSL